MELTEFDGKFESKMGLSLIYSMISVFVYSLLLDLMKWSKSYSFLIYMFSVTIVYDGSITEVSITVIYYGYVG